MTIQRVDVDRLGRRHAVREAFKIEIRRAAKRMGLEVSRYRGSFAEHRASLLREDGVDVVYDVGANVGQYAASLRRSGYVAKIVSIEPNPSAVKALARRAAHDTSWSVVGCALGQASGRSTLHVSANSLSSSLLQIEQRHLRAYPESAYIADVTVVVRTLDDVVAETAGKQEALFVKLDVQGHEEAVLAGASASLSRVVALEVECSLTNLYASQAGPWQLLQRLYEGGFVAVDMERVCWDASSGDLLQVNVLLRRNST
jgi:FkbM family methyltransferase